MGDATGEHTSDAPIKSGREGESSLPRLGGRRLRPEAPTFTLGDTGPTRDDPPRLEGARAPLSQPLALRAEGDNIQTSDGGRASVTFESRIPGFQNLRVSDHVVARSDVHRRPPQESDSSLLLELARAQAQLAAREAEIVQLRGVVHQSDRSAVEGPLQTSAPASAQLHAPPQSLWEPSEALPPVSRASVFDRLHPRSSAFDAWEPGPPTCLRTPLWGGSPVWTGRFTISLRPVVIPGRSRAPVRPLWAVLTRQPPSG